MMYLGDTAFYSGKQVERYIKDMLASYIGDVLDDDCIAILNFVIKYHPNASEKIGVGIQGFVIGPSLHRGGGNCFWIKRLDGTKVDFSSKKLNWRAIDREVYGRAERGESPTTPV